jgi:VIT1/CCC1 family predicted Fe2+/Mn2+ transporter
MAKDPLAAHARDELGISEMTTARPVQAALASACTFAAGAILPLIVVVLSPWPVIITNVAVASLFFLAALGAAGARAGGAAVLRPVLRVTFWGALAMAATAGVGALFGVAA